MKVKQLFANKCNTADEMDQFLERHRLLEHTQQVISVNPVSIK